MNYDVLKNTSAHTESLMVRVSKAIDGRVNPDQWLHMEAARAAIREVIDWLDEYEFVGAVHALYREVNRD